MTNSSPSAPDRAPFAPADTLLDVGRVLRTPVSEWVPEICAKLQRCSLRPGLRSVEDIYSALNNAALIFAHARKVDVAQCICQRQLAWFDRGAACVPDSGVLTLAIQPWVNLGRLHRRSGNYESALQYFLALGDDTFWSAIHSRYRHTDTPASFLSAAEPIYIYESIRTYIQMGDLDRAMSFAAGLGESLHPASDLLRAELTIQLLIEKRAFGDLLSLVGKTPWPGDTFGILTRHLYACLALCVTGQQEKCASGLARMLPHLRSWIDQRSSLDSRDVRLAMEVFRLASHSGVAELFPLALSGAMAAVLKARDVIYAAQLLRAAEGSPSTDLEPLRRFVTRFTYHSFSTADNLAIERLSEAVKGAPENLLTMPLGEIPEVPANGEPLYAN